MKAVEESAGQSHHQRASSREIDPKRERCSLKARY
ncbi:MAG: hypothetical protein ACI8ZN_001122, partial [Bacteroidia bacterium]